MHAVSEGELLRSLQELWRQLQVAPGRLLFGQQWAAASGACDRVARYVSISPSFLNVQHRLAPCVNRH